MQNVACFNQLCTFVTFCGFYAPRYVSLLFSLNRQLSSQSNGILIIYIDTATCFYLPTKQSCGFDGISSKLLQIIEPVIFKSLTMVINQVLSTGIFPDKLKIAKVIPIFKKDDPTLFKNYRPISLLSTI